ncbi:MAG: PTS system mannose-specific IIA component [Gammaproteobacteria bacterium]|jgi:PTS system mannose-specific IIA component
MSVGILIISHNGIGAALFGTANFMIKESPLDVKLLSANRDSDVDDLYESAILLVKELDSGDGVLVLTDLYGSTPSNIANSLHEHANINIVTGLNLSMLIRLFNYPDLNLADLTEKAYSGGIDGITINQTNGNE